MNKIFKIQEKIINLIYPQVCGICGKINYNAVCPKCNVHLKKQGKMDILTKEELKENSLEKEKFFEELIYIFKYEGQIRELILDYKFNEKSYMYKTFVNFLLKNNKNIQKTSCIFIHTNI